MVTELYSIELEGSQKSLLSRAVQSNKPVKIAVTCGAPKIVSMAFGVAGLTYLDLRSADTGSSSSYGASFAPMFDETASW